MQGNVLALSELAAADCGAWQHHAARSLPVRSPYYSLGFARAVDAVRGGVRVLRLQAASGDGAYLPFQLLPGRGSLLHSGEKVGGELSDFFGIIAPQGFRLSAAELLARSGLSTFHFDHLPEAMASLETGEVEITEGFRLDIGGTADAYFARLLAGDKHFAKQLARREKQLTGELGPLCFEWQTRDTAAELDRLIEVKAEQFRRSGMADLFAVEWRRKLLYHLVERQDPECCGVLSTLWAGSTWVASHLGLQYEDVLHSWFPTYNYKIARFNPGHLLLKHLIAEAPSSGLRFIDFGQGDSQYKRKYLSDPYVLRKGVLRDRGIRALADRVWQAAEWRLHERRQARRNLASGMGG